ncbi:hypothetical protein [Insolitispirillum peregrinum]|uniref:DUF945 domain-containing protein n=1 Tax=Insolitispirillum peregrinum TaxID=80876 RepID=A0A1N7LAY6_9PROT|nr:hypothetical protein [Insolitispirillum peregrinum]SIS70959.1 hypothetical protein SAMN05421779_103213 [Insolitispirillum peregrinum]
MSKKVLIGGLAGVVVVGLAVGGWVYATHKATEFAKAEVDKFLVTSQLQGKVTYQEVTASPLGSASIKGIAVTAPEAQGVTIDEISVKDAEFHDGKMYKGTLNAHGVKVPLVELANRQTLSPRDQQLVQGMARMGYGVLYGDLGMTSGYDAKSQQATSVLSLSIKDMLTLSLDVGYGNVSEELIKSFMAFSELAATGTASQQQMVGQLLGALGQAGNVTLLNNSFRVDLQGLAPRLQKELDKEQPGLLAQQAGVLSQTLSQGLIKAGVAQADAQKAGTAVSELLQKGTPLTVKSNMAVPLPVFKNGNFMMPAFTDVGTYLAVTKTTISSGT